MSAFWRLKFHLPTSSHTCQLISDYMERLALYRIDLAIYARCLQVSLVLEFQWSAYSPEMRCTASRKGTRIHCKSYFYTHRSLNSLGKGRFQCTHLAFDLNFAILFSASNCCHSRQPLYQYWGKSSLSTPVGGQPPPAWVICFASMAPSSASCGGSAFAQSRGRHHAGLHR